MTLRISAIEITGYQLESHCQWKTIYYVN